MPILPSWTKSVVSYWTMMTLTFQSSQLELSMNEKLVQMALSTERAASLTAASAENEQLAAMNLETAEAQKLEAETLQEEATVLLEKSNVDSTLAASEQTTADELDADIIRQQEQTAAHVATALVEEETFESEMAEAGMLATDATQHEIEAHSEELGIGLCEFIPFVDVVCDIVGGISAIGLEMGAAAEVLDASEATAAAMIAKEQEEKELGLAAESEAKAVDDAEIVAGLEADITELTELAEEERIQGEEDELAATELLEQAAVEEEDAIEESAQAIAEEAQAATATRQALLSGVGACWDAIMANIVGCMACLYFASRVASSFVLPWISSAIRYVFTVPANISKRKDPCYLLVPSNARSDSVVGTAASFFPWSCSSYLGRNIVYIFHHCAILILSISSWATTLASLKETSLRTRGGIILLVAIIGAAIQTILLHAIPLTINTRRVQYSTRMLYQVLSIVFESIQRMILLLILFVLEILILWVNFGQRIFGSSLWVLMSDNSTHQLCMWSILVVLVLTTHVWLMEEPVENQGHLKIDNDEFSSPSSVRLIVPSEVGDCNVQRKRTVQENTIEATESESLLSSVKTIYDDGGDDHDDYDNNQIVSTQSHTLNNVGYFRPDFSFIQEMAKLQFPFEILMLSCMVQLLRHCIPSLLQVWPFAQATLLHVWPDWIVPFGFGCGILVAIWAIILICTA